MAQPELASYLGPDDTGRALQGRGRFCPFVVGAVHGVEDGGLAEVVGQPGLGDRDEAEPGVLDAALEHFRDDLADPVGELARPRGVHAVTPPRCTAAAAPTAAQFRDAWPRGARSRRAR